MLKLIFAKRVPIQRNFLHPNFFVFCDGILYSSLNLDRRNCIFCILCNSVFQQDYYTESCILWNTAEFLGEFRLASLQRNLFHQNGSAEFHILGILQKNIFWQNSSAQFRILLIQNCYKFRIW